ncbi:LexA family transcriptional regulator [Rhizobium halophilum]|uniref:LexA family transcriptional regulator n=1 Tax=Rhizobium halophilum TaxID=2846852 RepID=UPI001EFD8734|nr:LexA family transcriptional regulator [Rhizobium halophilum]MCF6368312.1 hypothetical protein [Rhizobium halophilum]
MTALALPHINYSRMALDQRETKEWLRAIARHLNLSPSQLALNSGMAASTLTRYLNDNSNSVGITQSSLEKVARYSGFRPNQLPGGSRPGVAEPDAIPFRHDNREWPEWVRTAVEAARGGRNGVEAWVMKGAALDGLGVMPDDILLIDQNARPKSGDVVLAQIVDYSAGTAETVMRLYQAPFLITHSMRLGPGRPEHVDEDRVSIAGVSVGSIRIQH